MASTVFSDALQTVIVASWLNDVNTSVYQTLPNFLNVTLPTLLTSAAAASIYSTPAQIASVYLSQANAAIQYVAKTSGVGSAGVPSGTTVQRDAAPVTGYLRFNTTLQSFEGYSGTVWGAVGGGATGAGGDTVFVENSRIVTTNYTLSVNKSASVVGPLIINGGVTVTVPSGQRLVVL